MSLCDRYQLSNGSKLVCFAKFVVAIFIEVIRIGSYWIRLVCGDQTIPSTMGNYVMNIYMEMEQIFDALRPINRELIDNVLGVGLVTFGVGHF